MSLLFCGLTIAVCGFGAQLIIDNLNRLAKTKLGSIFWLTLLGVLLIAINAAAFRFGWELAEMCK